MISYIDQWNAFMDLSLGTASANEIVVYMRLFQLNNMYHWREWFATDNIQLAMFCGLNEKSLINARNGLKQKGFIEFIPGKKGQKSQYRLVPLSENNMENILQNSQSIEQYNGSKSAVKVQYKCSKSAVNTGGIKRDRYKDVDKDVDVDKEKKIATLSKKKFVPPTLEEINEYILENNLNVEAAFFLQYFTESGWVDSKGNKVKNWKQKLLTWNRFGNGKQRAAPDTQNVYADIMKGAMELVSDE